MINAQAGTNERRRSDALRRYDVVRGSRDVFYDNIVEMAASIFDAPIALISIVDGDLTWFKAQKGIDTCEVRRSDSFCDHAISGSDVLVVTDAADDERFRENPYVIGCPDIRFYAGAPIFTADGTAIGTLCVLDTKPREVPEEKSLGLLKQMAGLVMQQIAARSLESVKRGALELTRATPDGVVVIGADREVLFWNRSAERILGYGRRDIVGRSIENSLPDLAGDRLMKAIEWSRRAPFECDATLPDGTIRPIEFSATPWTDNSKAYVGFVIRDITERRQAQKGLEEARTLAENQQIQIEDNQRFVNAVIENLPSVVLAKDEEHRYVLVNSAAEKFFEMSRNEMIGKTAHELFPPANATQITDEDVLALALAEGDLLEEDYLHSATDGDRILKTKKLVIAGSESRGSRILVLGEDVTDERASVAHIRYMANHDPLTSLTNRLALHEQMEASLRAVADSGDFALLYLDLDDFKSVNDTLGHLAGDGVLKDCARRMSAVVPSNATLARLGGDEFAILIPGPDSETAALAVAQSLREALGEAISIDGHMVAVGTSIGLVIAPRHAATPEEVLRCADVALYEAKRVGRGTICVFDPELDQVTRDRHALGNDLRHAVLENQFELHYQPIYTTFDTTLVGYEALIRWRHPNRGLVSPADFIPIAEETGLIHEIGEWVIRTACEEASTWPGDLQVAVNLSPVQFKRRSLPLIVGSALSHSGLSPARLELEITESVMLDETLSNLALLKQLQALGVKIALDDFGVGYSSLSYLRSFPFAKLKIDRSFVSEMGASEEAQAIVRAITTLGRNLAMVTTAEGVETAEQFEAARSERCDLTQGFFHGRPMPASELPHKLADVTSSSRAKSIATA